MTAAAEISLQAGELPLAGLAWGPGGGRPVLALHGWLDNAASFSRLAPLLPAYRFVALDLPGHGRSGHVPPGAVYHFIDSVEHVLAAIDALGWNRPIVVGHSMGAGVATLFAGAFPDRIDRLVLIEGVGPLAERPGSAPGRLADAIARSRALDPGPPRSHPSLEAAVRARLDGSSLDRDAAELLVRRGAEIGADGRVRFRHDPRLRLPSRLRLTEDQVLAFVAAIRCPTLVVWGESGYPFADQVAARSAHLASATVRTLPGGHHLHLTNPRPVADVVAAFCGG